ncbi:hypothetical protein [Hyphococcus sp.]|uniref:hypothetical protein n=1 Tax=Hyphococcus sp. TaxID=2038636 RepID=UPI0037527BB2
MSETMTKSAFARLCQVSHPNFAPAKWGQFLVLRGGKVDAKASLDALEGRLDESKRKAALEKLKNRPAPPATEAAAVDEDPADDEPAATTAPAASEPTSFKAERDMYAAKNAQIDYLERVGALIDAAEVGAAIESLVATFWAEADLALKMDAAEIASDLELDGEQARKLRNMMIRRNRVLRQNFERACRSAEAQVKPDTRAAA